MATHADVYLPEMWHFLPGSSTKDIEYPGRVMVYRAGQKVANEFLSLDVNETAGWATINTGSAVTNGLVISTAAGDLKLDPAGDVLIQDDVYVAEDVYFGDTDLLIMGDDSDSQRQFTGTALQEAFAAPTADVAGAGYSMTLQAGGAVTSGAGLAGGSGVLTAGAGSAAFAASGLAGGAGGGWQFVLGQGGAGDGAGADGRTGTFTITGGNWIEGGTADATLHVTGTLNATEAAGGTDVYRALHLDLTTTDITGWDNVYFLDCRDDTTSMFSVDITGAMTLAGGIFLPDNVQIKFGNTAAVPDAAWYSDGEALALNFVNVAALKLDGAAISDYTGAADTAGQAFFAELQGAGAVTVGAGLAGATGTFTAGAGSAGFAGADNAGGAAGGWTFVGGAGGAAASGGGATNGGAGGIFKFVQGAGGAAAGGGTAGAEGSLQVWHSAQAAGDYVLIQHDATNAAITAGSGNLTMTCGTGSVTVLGKTGSNSASWNGIAFYPSAAQTAGLGTAAAPWLSAYVGQDTTTGSVSTSGVYFGAASVQEARLRYNKDATGYPASTLILGVSATGSAAADRLAIGATAASAGSFIAAADTSGADIYLHTQQGGAHSAANPNGGSVYVVPGTLGAGGAGAAGVFAVRDPASTDTIAFSHDGSRGYLTTTHELRATTQVTIADNIKLALGNDADWALKEVTTSPANHLELMEGATPALAFFGSTLVAQGFAAASNTPGNDLFLATQTAGTHVDANPRGGNLNIELGTGTGTGVQGILGVNGPVSITPATAAAGLTITQANNAVALTIDSASTTTDTMQVYGKVCARITQDVSGGSAVVISRNIAEAGSFPLAQFIDDHASVTQSCLLARSDSSTVTTPAIEAQRLAIAATSTDGLLLSNTTAATAGVTVQYSPRMRWRGHAWNSTGLASETHDYVLEVIPMTVAGTTTSRLQLSRSVEGGAYSAILQSYSTGSLIVGASGTSQVYAGSVSPNTVSTLALQVNNFTAADSAVEMATGTWTHSTGTGVAVEIKPTWNASGDAAETCLLINSTSTAVGSGAYYLIDAKDDTTRKFSVNSDGLATMASLYSLSNDATLTIQGRAFTVADNAVEMATGAVTNTTGEYAACVIKPTINQASGDGNWVGLLLDVTTTAEGSNGGLFFECKDDTVTKFSIMSGGQTGIISDAVGGAALTAGWNSTTLPATATYGRHFYTQGNVTEQADTAYSDICGWYINTFTITAGGGTTSVGTVASCYIAGAPTAGTAPTNGPYALFVDAGTSRFDGSIIMENAAGATIVNEAATTTNPTLIPNRAEEDTGIGWASDTIHFVGGGSSLGDISATGLSFPQAAQIDTSGDAVLTLTGGTLGVRVDDCLGIDSAPTGRNDIYMGRSFTGTGAANIGGLHIAHTATMGTADSYEGVFVSPAVTEAATGTHPTIAGVYINNFTVTDGAGDEVVTNLAGLYIAGAPIAGTTPTNGPFAIFVDAGACRFDGVLYLNDDITVATGKSIQTTTGADESFSLKAYDTNGAAYVTAIQIQNNAAAGAKLGFFGVAPVDRPGAITQTYSTADATHAARTAPGAGGGSGADGTTFSGAQCDALVADQQDTAQLLNYVIDQLQDLGLLQ